MKLEAFIRKTAGFLFPKGWNRDALCGKSMMCAKSHHPCQSPVTPWSGWRVIQCPATNLIQQAFSVHLLVSCTALCT